MDDLTGVPASDPSPAAPPAATPASADPTPAAAPQGTVSGEPAAPVVDPATPSFGPIPYDRFKVVNTRMQDAERRVKEFQDTYGDVLGLPADQAKQMASFARQLAQDPVQTAIQLSDQLMTHPTYGPQMASAAARWLASRRGQGPKPEPEPDLMAENGQPVYSAPRLREWKAWADQQTEARILQRIAPLEQAAQATQRERQLSETRQRADAEAGALLDTAKSWYGFEKHQTSVATAFKEHPGWTLQDAYLHVLHSEILPAMPAQAQATVVAQLQQKAAAQTMNPTGGVPASTPDFKGDFTKALEWAAQKK
jgi:hypothetical protein